jgi:hypothetical protein
VLAIIWRVELGLRTQSSSAARLLENSCHYVGVQLISRRVVAASLRGQKIYAEEQNDRRKVPPTALGPLACMTRRDPSTIGSNTTRDFVTVYLHSHFRHELAAPFSFQ